MKAIIHQSVGFKALFPDNFGELEAQQPKIEDHSKMDNENTISKAKNILIALPSKDGNSPELDHLKENFCGVLVAQFSEIQGDLGKKRIYACGDIAQLENKGVPLQIIQELSFNYEDCDLRTMQIIPLGKVPVIVGNAGVFFRRLFDGDGFFDSIKAEHLFQDLTESNKPGKALRKGIYLSEVSREFTEEQNEILQFQLLRCSSNLSGPTDNFRATDHHIMATINDAAEYIFEQKTTLNHVLAQIYENKKKTEHEGKETKARIKAHSDKTKDMPQDALIAFCTFYEKSNFDHLKPSNTDRYDWCYKQGSGLTRLHFRLKSSVNDPTLEKEFSVLLYPNSVFFIPLSTNRLYTHEIRPSMLDVDKVPTRLGYVARCSKTEALFMNGQTHLKEDGKLIPLEEMAPETMERLKNAYMEENKTEFKIQYDKVHFSMNLGDYQKPIY